MDRRIVLAVAGAGKTSLLIDRLNLDEKFLFVTYTENNLAHVRHRVINKFGYKPQNITLFTYFQFLIHVCYRPFLMDKVRAKGISWAIPPQETRYRKGISHYLTRTRFLYSNRISQLCDKECATKIKERIEMFYDVFMIDEVQDLGGHDFNLIQNILPTKIDCLFVGDFYQHTFDTSRDGNVNGSLYNNYQSYKRKWLEKGIFVDEQSLSNSFRSSPSICEFVYNNLNIRIQSNKNVLTEISFIDNQENAEKIFLDNSIIKLFYQDSQKYPCKSENWGKSKGQDHYEDVCVVLNKTTLAAYQKKKLTDLAPATRNKLYVACTRANRNLYFVPYLCFDKYKVQKK